MKVEITTRYERGQKVYYLVPDGKGSYTIEEGYVTDISILYSCNKGVCRINYNLERFGSEEFAEHELYGSREQALRDVRRINGEEEEE